MKRRLWIFIFGLCVVLSVGVTTLSTAQAQGNLNWTAQYYNNKTLSGSPVVTTTFNNLNINWGTSAPANGVGVDDWTARFSTVAPFNAGTYRFSINADDAVRLYVHGTLLLDTFSNPKPNQVVTADYTFPASGSAGVQLDYREYVGNAFLYVSWQQISSLPINQPPVTISGAWLAQYYNNTSLTGSPMVITSHDRLQLNWGRGIPVGGLGADDWTARFNTTVNLSAGTYRFDINADDAFRLYVNNQLKLETFNNPQPNKWMSADVSLPGGNVSLQVDYREYIGDAFLYFSWQRLGDTTSPQPQPQQPAVPAVIINTSRLNFRSAPFIADNIIARLGRGERYTVTGRTPSRDWYRIQVGQTTGWVSASYVITVNTNDVPVVNVQQPPSPPPVNTGFTLRTTANLNVRSGPSTVYSRIMVLRFNQRVTIIGRNGNNTWWQIRDGNTTGWVSGAYVALPSNIDFSRIPVTG